MASTEFVRQQNWQVNMDGKIGKRLVAVLCCLATQDGAPVQKWQMIQLFSRFVDGAVILLLLTAIFRNYPSVKVKIKYSET